MPKNKKVRTPRELGYGYKTKDKTISTFTDAKKAAGGFSLKRFPLRKTIKERLEDSELGNGGVPSEAAS